MRFETPLLDGILIKRYKRFLADIKLAESGEIILAHVANSGSMIGVKDPGSPCRLSLASNPNRKLKYSLEMVKAQDGSWVGINTSLTNKLVAEAFCVGRVASWRKFETLDSEVKINSKSRLDFLMSRADSRHYVEVKNVSMAQPPWAVFPDAVTERGQKHLKELMLLSKKGHGSEIFFVIQREDCDKFKPCDEIDPEYGKLLRAAVKSGVHVQAWSCRLSADEISIHREIPVKL